MPYDVLFIPAVTEDELRLSFEAALPIAEKQRSQIAVAYCEDPLPANVASEVYWQPATLKSYEAEVQARRERLKAEFYELCARHGIETAQPEDAFKHKGVVATWQDFRGDRSIIFGQLGRLADLSVIALGHEPMSHWMTVMAEDLLTQAPSPLLVVPQSAATLPPSRVVVGWNGSVEASRAIQFAMPFLSAAKSVHVVTVREKHREWPSADDAATFLRSKGVDAEGHNIDRSDQHTDDLIVDEAQRVDADLLVLGAFSRPRWRQLFLGSMTRRALTNPPLPVLLAH
ncbi:universal stress protein [Parvularcula lutaonensis]|uniref:Universal stress protein n=1 Tax=Parvularcula lutaonensis TaxID=491923 RepID=A0ABV7MFA4_9PROT|nr:universal stress protein [Parvularcula lutaonensis]GGY52954.1 universal stress protein UspA [Parvularcula lutaonensis]